MRRVLEALRASGEAAAILMGVPYVCSAVCDRSRRPGSAWSSDAEDENTRPKNVTAVPRQAMRTRPVSARPRLMTAAQPPQLEPGVTLSAQPPSGKHPRGARVAGRPASARPASDRPASARPASTRSARVRPASVRPPSLRPASAATAELRGREQAGGTRQWQRTYRPVSASGCSVWGALLDFFFIGTHFFIHI